MDMALGPDLTAEDKFGAASPPGSDSLAVPARSFYFTHIAGVRITIWTTFFPILVPTAGVLRLESR